MLVVVTVVIRAPLLNDEDITEQVLLSDALADHIADSEKSRREHDFPDHLTDVPFSRVQLSEGD